MSPVPPPPLDQVSSQAMARLAAARGLRVMPTPLSETAARGGRGWKRWLPYFFLALSVFALGGMTLGIAGLAEGGWSWSDGLQLALMALLVAGVFSQARTMLRPTRLGRWFAAWRRGHAEPAVMLHVPLEVVSAEYLAATRPAEVSAMRRAVALRRAGSRWSERVSVWSVVSLAVAAFGAMAALFGWIAYAEGIDAPATWLTAPFTALTGFASWSVFGAARRMAFRGRPFALISRAFRDSVRLWGSGSIATKAALTTTATASVAGAAVAPALIQRDTQYDMFVIDSETSAVYRIDLATDVSARAGVRGLEQVKPIALTTTSTPVKLASGRTLPKGSLVAVLEGTARGGQSIVAFAPGSNAPVEVARIQPAVPGARFTGGPGLLHAAQPDGTFWQIDMRTGAAMEIGEVAVPVGPLTYEAESRTIVMASGTDIVRLDPESGAVLGTSPADVAGNICGIADGPGDLLFFTFESEPEIRLLRTKSRGTALVRPTADFAAAPCEVAVAYRK